MASFIYFRKHKASAGNRHLPPGPKPVPVLGNVRDFQAKELWLPAMNWAKQYGEHCFQTLALHDFAFCGPVVACIVLASHLEFSPWRIATKSTRRRLTGHPSIHRRFYSAAMIHQFLPLFPAQYTMIEGTDCKLSAGELVYLHIFSQGIIFVNSPEAASDLLDKRGSIYSDKPQFTMVCDL